MVLKIVPCRFSLSRRRIQLHRYGHLTKEGEKRLDIHIHGKAPTRKSGLRIAPDAMTFLTAFCPMLNCVCYLEVMLTSVEVETD